MLFPSWEPLFFDLLYHKYRGYCITDYALNLVFKADGLWKVTGFYTNKKMTLQTQKKSIQKCKKYYSLSSVAY